MPSTNINQAAESPSPLPPIGQVTDPHRASIVAGYRTAQRHRQEQRDAEMRAAVESITTRVDRTDAEHAARLAALERRIAELSDDDVDAVSGDVVDLDALTE